MDDKRPVRLIGMAMARDLVSLEALQHALEKSRESDALLQSLQQDGILDVVDLEILGKLLDQPPVTVRSGAGSSPKHSSNSSADSGGLFVQEPQEGDDAGCGKDVLHLTECPAWRQYRDLRLIGEGGMGRIFIALDPSLKRSVALKFIRRDEPTLVKRFVLEAQHQAMLDHPNVCKVFEVGEWKGQAYIAMQYIHGMTLEAAALNMSLPEKLETMEIVADAIHVAHSRGLIHRDLKPANIMVERSEDGVWKPYILDFGLARGRERSGLTVHGAVFGTLGYMSPEQFEEDSAKVGYYSDIYALGATLYKLLTGSTPVQASGGETSTQDPLPLRKRKPDLPMDLEILVMACLEREPRHRYPSAKALAEDLRRFRNGDPILMSKTSRWYRLVKLARKNRRTVMLSAVLAALTLLFAGREVYGLATDSVRARWAEHYGLEAERIEASIRYAHLKPQHDIREELEQARSKLEEMERKPFGRYEEGPAAYAIGRGYLALGEPEKARQWLTRARAKGFRAIEVSYALGRALGLLYQKEFEQSRLIEDPTQQMARQSELGKDLRDPALDYLKAGSGSSAESPAYNRALIAYYEKRYPEALNLAHQAYEESSWFYEAKKLEGDILLAMARETPDEKVSGEMLESAANRYEEAQKQAPSDPGICLKTIQTRIELARQNPPEEANPSQTAELQSQLDRVQAIRPDIAEAISSLSQALNTPGVKPSELSLEQILKTIKTPKLDADGLPILEGEEK